MEQEKNSGRLPFRVGGLFNLSGVPTDEVYGVNSVVGALIVRRGIGGTLRKPAVYLGGSIEAGNAWNATDTLLGPIHLALGKAERRDPTIYFYLGRVLPWGRVGSAIL